MTKLGTQIVEQSLILKDHSQDEHKEIRAVLEQLNKAYVERDLQNVDSFINEFFVAREDKYIIGTATGELFWGTDGIKEVLSDDWSSWGDVQIHFEKARIDKLGERAWFCSSGSIKYSFEDSEEREERILSWVRDTAKEEGLNSQQKISYINWILSLSFHKREESERDYFWPLGISGVFLKEKGRWKIAQLHFSVSNANFPDERFENSHEHLESYNEQNENFSSKESNQIDEEVKNRFRILENNFNDDLVNHETLVKNNFTKMDPLILMGPDTILHQGSESIAEYFDQNKHINISLNTEEAYASKSGDITWFTIFGVVKQYISEETLAERSLEELEKIIQSSLSTKDSIFAIQKNTAYTLKESSMGLDYTYPIKISGLMRRPNDKLLFSHMHISYPFYWIIEGKLINLS